MALGAERSQTVAARARQRCRLPEGNISTRDPCMESACVRLRIGMVVPEPRRPVAHRRARAWVRVEGGRMRGWRWQT